MKSCVINCYATLGNMLKEKKNSTRPLWYIKTDLNLCIISSSFQGHSKWLNIFYLVTVNKHFKKRFKTFSDLGSGKTVKKVVQKTQDSHQPSGEPCPHRGPLPLQDVPSSTARWSLVGLFRKWENWMKETFLRKCKCG